MSVFAGIGGIILAKTPQLGLTRGTVNWFRMPLNPTTRTNYEKNT